jgi:glycosyltransferase A (GT-A) superfamily protein (DUF2064 family)
VVPQRGDGLAVRLAHGFRDTALPDVPSLLIGMDTPQVSSEHLTRATDLLATADAVLGLAQDGGWWALGLRRPEHAELLRTVPMSTPDTGRLTAEALRREGLCIAELPVLRDVDNAGDAHAVAAECPDGDFARTVTRLIPGGNP